ncbi:MAG: hypothetical protein WDW36_001966 [Sanguina aurantia]
MIAPERVKVLVRVRPCLRDEESPGALAFSTKQDGSCRMTLFRPDAPITQSEYVFDKVLGPEATQHDMYACGVKDVIADVLQGYNGTVMAYGQTGAGKTYTLGNTDIATIGMIPRAVADIFNRAAEDAFHTFTITMSYMQIYCELIQDLLNPTSENLNIREDNSNGVFVAGLSEVPVAGLQECLHFMEVGERNRAFAFTHLNAHSSRSHAVVMLTVVKSRKYLTGQEMAEARKAEKEGLATQKVKVGKLYLVDLAGSERLKKSKSVGQRAHEAKAINLSLSTLGMCISARAMDQPHVPFRDSKLTRLLQESLGGNAKTVLLVCVADVREHADETLQSLQFAARAMCVKNKPVVNERLNYKELHAQLMSQMDVTSDKSNVLEAVLVRSEEEKAALQRVDGAALGNLDAMAKLQASVIDQGRASVDAAKAEALRSQLDSTRYRDLSSRSAVSLESAQKAEADFRTARAGTIRALAVVQGAQQQLNVIATQKKQVQAALAQACEAVRLHRVIVDLQLGMSQSQLALSASNTRVEGVEMQLAEARAELALKRAEALENEETLDAYRSTLLSREEVISAQSGNLHGKDAQLEEGAGERSQLEAELAAGRGETRALEASLVALGERLAAEQSLRAALQARLSALLSLGGLSAVRRGTDSAARLIQRTYRRWKAQALQRRMEKEVEEHQGSQAALGVLEQASRRAVQLQDAATGARLVRESLTLVRSGLGSLLTSFLLPKKDLERKASLSRTLSQLSPMTSTPPPFKPAMGPPSAHLPPAPAPAPAPAFPHSTPTHGPPPHPSPRQLPASLPTTPSNHPSHNRPLLLQLPPQAQALPLQLQPSQQQTHRLCHASTPVPAIIRPVDALPPQHTPAIANPSRAQRDGQRVAAGPAPPNPHPTVNIDRDSSGSTGGRRGRGSAPHSVPPASTPAGAAAASASPVAAAAVAAAGGGGSASLPPKTPTPFASATAPGAVATGRTTPSPAPNGSSSGGPAALPRSSSNEHRRGSQTSVPEPGSPGRGRSLSAALVTPAAASPGAIPRHVLLPSPPQAEDSGFTGSEVSSRANSNHGPF